MVEHLKPARVQARQHSGGIRKLYFAVGEDAIVILEIDVDMQTVERNLCFTIGSRDAFQTRPIVVAIAALMEAEDIPRRHGAPPGQAGELLHNVGDAVSEQHVVVELTVKSSEDVPAEAISGRSVTDIEVRLRNVVEEQPVTVRRPGIGAGGSPVDLDQQRD